MTPTQTAAGGPCRGNDSRCPGKNEAQCNQLEKEGTDCRWQWNGDGCCHGNHQECAVSNPTRCKTQKTLSGKNLQGCFFVKNGESVKSNHYMYTCGHRRRVQNNHINDPISKAGSDPYSKSGDGCKCTQNDAKSCFDS